MDSIEDFYDDYATDPSLARLRSRSQMVWPMGEHDSCDLAVLADSPIFLDLEEVSAVGEMFAAMNPYFSYVLKFFEGVVAPAPSEWQAAKALVSREIRLTKPKAWIPVGTVSCELLGVPQWHPATSSVQIDHSHSGAFVVQGGWKDCKEAIDILLDPKAGFVSRG